MGWDEPGDFDGFRPPTPTTGDQDEQIGGNDQLSPTESLRSVVRRTHSMVLGEDAKVDPRVLQMAQRLQNTVDQTNRQWKRMFAQTTGDDEAEASSSHAVETHLPDYTSAEEAALLGDTPGTFHVSPSVEAELLGLDGKAKTD